MRALLRWGCVALVALGCGESVSSPAANTPEALVAVRSLRVTSEQIVEPIRGTGTIIPDKSSDIGPRVDGIIEAIHVQVGDRVRAGDPLFRTRDVDYRVRVEEAEHAARLAWFEAEKAGRDRARVERLFGSGIASTEQIESARTADDMATARLGRANAVLARARQNLDDTLVRAPFAGAITQRFVDEGVMMRTMIASGAAVVQLMKTDVVLAIIRIPEVHLRQIRVGTPGRVRIDGLDGEFDSAVAVLNDRVDPGSRTIEVRLPLANPESAIKPGLFARATLLPAARTATVVERRAVLGAAEERYVFVPAEGRATRRTVRVRDLDAGRLEILEGLVPGDRVLLAPARGRIEEGMPVRIELADVAL